MYSNVCRNVAQGMIRYQQCRAVVKFSRSSFPLCLSQRCLSGNKFCKILLATEEMSCYFQGRYCVKHGRRNVSTVELPSDERTVVPLDTLSALLRSKIIKEHYLSKQDVTRLLADLPKESLISEGLCSLLLQCCADFIPSIDGTEKIHLAKQIWDTFNNNGYKFNKEDIIRMIEVYKSARQPLDNTFWTSVDPSCKSDPDFLLSWLQCAAEIGDQATSTEVVDKIRQSGVKLDEEILACLVLAHGRARDYKQIKNILNILRDEALEPGLDTYIALLLSQIENDQPISQTIVQMRNAGFVPTDKHIASLVYSIAVSKRENLLNMVMRTKDCNKLSIELKNCVIELIYEGYVSLAVRIITDFKEAFGSLETSTIFALFIPRELVSSNMKPVDILRICSFLQQTFPNHQSFLLAATEASLKDVTKMEMSIELLHKVTPLRNHYFWPLTVRAKNVPEIVNVFNIMQRLGLKLDFDTLAYYSFPNLIKTNTPINILQQIQKSSQIPISLLLAPLVHALLNAKMLNEAVVLCKQYKQRTMDLHSLVKPLLTCTLITKNYNATVTMLSLLSHSKDSTDRIVDVVGLFLSEYCTKCSIAAFKEMLKLIENSKMKISPASYEVLLSKCPTNESDLLPLFNAITSSALENGASFNPIPHPRDMGVEELEGHLIELKVKNLNTRGALRRLLQMHCKLNNPQRVLEIKKELDADGYTLSPGMLASLLAMHLLNKDCENATLVLKELASKYPTFVLDEFKIIDYCTIKLHHGATKDEVINILENFTNMRQKQGRKIRGGHGIQRNCQVLVTTAEHSLGKPDANSLLECLKTLNFVQ